MKLIYVAMLVGALTACSNKQNIDAVNNNTESTAHKIPYQLAKNYFVKKNFDTNILKKSYIDNQHDFDAIFGIARTMSKDGEATKIDFKNEIVIPIILEETNIGSTISIDTLNIIGNKIKVAYTVTEVQPISYIVQPNEIIIINKKEIIDLDKLDLTFEKTTKVL